MPTGSHDMSDSEYDAVIRQYLDRLPGLAAKAPSDATDLCRARLQAVVKYHAGRMTKDPQNPPSSQEVLNRLRQGEFAEQVRRGYDLVEDVILAALLQAGVDGAPQAFHLKFDGSIRQWTAAYAQGDGEIVDDFLTDLLLPREKTRDREASQALQEPKPLMADYRGEAPMDGWLRFVFRSEAARRRKKRGVVLESDEGSRVCHIDLDKEYVRKECTERLAPAFRQMFEGLEDDERTILQMSVVDQVEQKKIAALFGVRDYRITRMKQTAIKKVKEAFFAFAKDAIRMTEEAARECLELIRERFPDSGMPAVTIVKGD